MKIIKKLAIVFLTVCVCANVFVGCGGETGLHYPDYPTANSDSESWEQWEDYDSSQLTIDWYVDYSSFAWIGADASIVSNMIKEKTGITINFMTPVTDDGTQLNTLIAGNKLPDVITILANGAERVQLAEENYAYPINELSARWAPRLMNKIDPEITNYFGASDGMLYGLPSHFYTKTDMTAYEKQGHELLSNGAIVARKDYVEAYLAYMKGKDSAWDEKEVTTPQGFIDMCVWVKEKYNLRDNNPTVCLAPFETTNTTSGNKAINWLMEYFNVMPESADGNLSYQYEDERFFEMMEFLNALYNKKLIISSNFTTSPGQVGTYIQNGLPFVCVLSPQDYAANFKEWNLKNLNEDGKWKGDVSKEYVPIVLTNKDGEAPQLRSLAGNGYRFTMITANCKRPDRVIKLFDYLWSEEGRKLLYYGIENVTYTYTEPTQLYPYGLMNWTDTVKQAFNENQHGQYGMLNSFVFLTNPMFSYLTQESGYPFNNYTSYVNYNLKAALGDYVYNHTELEFPLDTSDAKYGRMISLRSKLYNLWIEYIPKIIMAENSDGARSKWAEGLDYAEKYGYKQLTEWQNEAFKKYKTKNGIVYAYPANDENSNYKNIKVDSVFGDVGRYAEVPEHIAIK